MVLAELKSSQKETVVEIVWCNISLSTFAASDLREELTHVTWIKSQREKLAGVTLNDGKKCKNYLPKSTHSMVTFGILFKTSHFTLFLQTPRD